MWPAVHLSSLWWQQQTENYFIQFCFSFRILHCYRSILWFKYKHYKAFCFVKLSTRQKSKIKQKPYVKFKCWQEMWFCFVLLLKCNHLSKSRANEKEKFLNFTWNSSEFHSTEWPQEVNERRSQATRGANFDWNKCYVWWPNK